MKNLVLLALLGALIYGGYRLFEHYTGGALDTAAREVGGEQLKRGQRMTRLTADRVEEARLQSVRNAVSAFKTERDRNPESLDELVDEGYIDRIPTGVTYDPETGEVAAG